MLPYGLFNLVLTLTSKKEQKTRLALRITFLILTPVLMLVMNYRKVAFQKQIKYF